MGNDGTTHGGDPVVCGCGRRLLPLSFSPASIDDEDDCPDLRGLLRARLNSELDIEVVGEASNGQEAARLARALAPSALVLDLDMPVMRGDDAIPLMRDAAPGMDILLYTGAAQSPLANGAAPDAIVGKRAPLTEVVAQLRALLERSRSDVVKLAM